MRRFYRGQRPRAPAVQQHGGGGPDGRPRAGDPTACAIASRRAAELYGLHIEAEHIQSVQGNSTRFIALSNRLILPPQANKISLIFTLPNVTGSLYKILARFSMEGLNLTKIESRPVRSGISITTFIWISRGASNSRGRWICSARCRKSCRCSTSWGITGNSMRSEGRRQNSPPFGCAPPAAALY